MGVQHNKGLLCATVAIRGGGGGDDNKTGQSKTEQRQAEQNRTEHSNRTDQGLTEHPKTGQKSKQCTILKIFIDIGMEGNICLSLGQGF